MSYRIGEFDLDPLKFELRRAGSVVAIEPQVFALLLLLVENRDRLTTKDEIIEKIWNGRFVSDSAVTSRVKSARQALGDDGREQQAIRTVHGKGYRFVAEVQRAPIVLVERPQLEPLPTLELPGGKPSIAVLPFAAIGEGAQAALIGDALPHEIIAELSRLRWLFVIARSSSFRFRAATPDLREIGQVLGVRYCLSGSISVDRGQMALTVELSDTRDGGVIWAEHYSAPAEAVHEVRARILAAVSTAVEIQIPLHEAQQARLRSPEALDAWSAYHVGLQHAFRFSRRDTAAAIAMFERAIAKEPGFARAHAGLSFAHFQEAFLGYRPDVGAAAGAARRTAEQALELDALDPFANFTFGRSLWLEHNLAGSLTWLDRAITLSPNYAQAIYSKAWAGTLLGDGDEGQAQVDTAIRLSPIDPLLYGMLATRALTHLTRGEIATAACWADEAAQSPGAHGHIALIAAMCHVLNDDAAKAESWTRTARARDPEISRERFFRSFPFEAGDTRERIETALCRLSV